jgi:hypothetical protein
MFDILANCPELKETLIQGLSDFEKHYAPWFSRFIRDLQIYFSELTADGVDMVSSQRPARAFPKLTKEQFRQYVLGIFQELIKNLQKGDKLCQGAINWQGNGRSFRP